jgi:hypothetical protein
VSAYLDIGFLVSSRTFQAHFDLDWHLSSFAQKLIEAAFETRPQKLPLKRPSACGHYILLARSLNSLPDSVLSLKERELAKDLTLS